MNQIAFDGMINRINCVFYPANHAAEGDLVHLVIKAILQFKI